MSKQLDPAVHKLKFERTFCMIKPDGVMRGLVGDIIARIERAGLKVVALRMEIPSAEKANRHYPMSDEAWVERLGEKSLTSLDELNLDPTQILGSDNKGTIGRGVADSLVEYLTSGPVVLMVVEGMHAIEMVRKLAGHTLPVKAAIGTIRGDFSVDSPAIANVEQRSIHNLFHASENQEEAENEIALWFDGADIPHYELGSESLMYAKYY